MNILAHGSAIPWRAAAVTQARRTMRRAKELAALETLFERSAATPRVLDHEGLHWTELFLICSFYSANNQIMSQG
jgi:hypothetical protein